MLQDRFDAALALIGEHNEAIGENNPGFIDSDKFLSVIKAAGGTSAERLNRFSYEDILECMPVIGDIKPKMVAKDIANVFRGKKENVAEETVYNVSSKKAAKMTLRELIENFDPEDPNSSIGKRLRDISRGEKFIIFSMGRLIDVENTKKLLEEVKKGFPGRNTFELDGMPQQVYRVGELPDNYADENPLFPGRPLRPDGTCDQLNRSWEGVAKEVRQLVRLALPEINISGDGGIDRAHNILTMALESDAFKKLAQRYQKAALQFQQKEREGNLPLLLIRLQPIQEVGVKALNEGKKVEWVETPVGYTSPQKAQKMFSDIAHYARRKQYPNHYYTPTNTFGDDNTPWMWSMSVQNQIKKK